MYNVLIRPLTEIDALLSWKWRNDPEVWQYTGRKPDQYITYEIEKIWIEKALSENTSRRFAILVNGEYVGNIQLTNIEENKTAEYHIFIGNKNYWGKSIAIMATHQIIRYAKTVLNLEEIYLNVNPNNIPAIKVYEKCNFIPVNKNIKMVLNLLEKSFPKVSIFMMVYNHEKYINEALNGILMQKCNFDYEIVIGEDCSTDKSRNIILEYSKQFPGKFKLLLHNSNIGAQKNQLVVLKNCMGQYIAMCEGDDYWTDPLKLVKQVDILDSNNSIGLVYTGVKHFNQNTGEFIEIAPRFVENRDEVIPSMLKSKYIEFPTTVFRKTVLDKVIDIIGIELENAIIGDTRILLETAYQSEIYFLNEVTTVYRILEGSASHPKEVDKFIFALKDSYLCRKTFVERNHLNPKWLSDTICNTNRGLINHAFVAKKYSDTIKFLKNILILDSIRFCEWGVFKRKMTAAIWIKLILAILGIGFLRQKLI